MGGPIDMEWKGCESIGCCILLYCKSPCIMGGWALRGSCLVPHNNIPVEQGSQWRRPNNGGLMIYTLIRTIIPYLVMSFCDSKVCDPGASVSILSNHWCTNTLFYLFVSMITEFLIWSFHLCLLHLKTSKNILPFLYSIWNSIYFGELEKHVVLFLSRHTTDPDIVEVFCSFLSVRFYIFINQSIQQYFLYQVWRLMLHR